MRDVTSIPNALLDVIARAIKLHVQGVFVPMAARIDALEKRELPAPVIVESAAPAVKDHTEAIDTLRRALEEQARQRAEDRRELDRAALVIDGQREKITQLEAREVPKPKDGEHGRDAFELDVLPAIDFARSYARGTLAQHEHGLWRAYANTEGQHGWACIVAGIHAVSVTRDDERAFSIRIVRTGGHVDASAFVMPVMIYRGVFSQGKRYTEGDTVTWAGSLWHCNQETDAKPDAGSGAWTLAAKRGSNGKDLQGVAA